MDILYRERLSLSWSWSPSVSLNEMSLWWQLQELLHTCTQSFQFITAHLQKNQSTSTQYWGFIPTILTVDSNDASFQQNNISKSISVHEGFLPNFWLAGCTAIKIVGCACARNAGNVFPPTRVSDPDMHHNTCVVHMSLTSGFDWSRWRGKRSWHSRRMRNPQFYVSGKRPMTQYYRKF